MDQLTRSYYGKEFQLAFLRKKGTEFQNWFVELMGHAFGVDFEPVRNYGSRGDFKCDGRHVSLGRIHQCYAPETLRDKETIAKINEDFTGAVDHWGTSMKVWSFVHNDPRGGLPPTVLQHLDSLRARHPETKIEVWGEGILRDIVLSMPVEKLTLIFGPAPTIPMLDKIGFPDLQPVIDALAQSQPDAANVPLLPPSPGKLEHNKLSVDVEDFLRIGRRKELLVADYMQKMVWPETPENIAEAMRRRYQRLKSLGLVGDVIYAHLEQFIGVHGEPTRKAAALAVMSYFFERCDIFEDVPNEVGS